MRKQFSYRLIIFINRVKQNYGKFFLFLALDNTLVIIDILHKCSVYAFNRFFMLKLLLLSGNCHMFKNIHPQRKALDLQLFRNAYTLKIIVIQVVKHAYNPGCTEHPDNTDKQCYAGTDEKCRKQFCSDAHFHKNTPFTVTV